MESSAIVDEVSSSELQSQSCCITEAVPPYRIVQVNPAWCRTTGFTQEAVIGRTCKLLQGPETCPNTLRVMHEALAAMQPIAVRLVNYRQDGTPFVNDLTIVPIRDSPTSTPSHFLGTVREHSLQPAAPRSQMSYSAMAPTGPTGPADVYVPTQLQEALQHELPHPQLITERVPPYKVIHVNRAWCQLSGHRAEHLIGKPYTVMFGLHTEPDLQPRLEAAFQRGIQHVCKATLYNSAQQPFGAKLIASPLLGTNGGDALYYVHVLADTAAVNGHHGCIDDGLRAPHAGPQQLLGGPMAAGACGSRPDLPANAHAGIHNGDGWAAMAPGATQLPNGFIGQGVNGADVGGPHRTNGMATNGSLKDLLEPNGLHPYLFGAADAGAGHAANGVARQPSDNSASGSCHNGCKPNGYLHGGASGSCVQIGAHRPGSGPAASVPIGDACGSYLPHFASCGGLRHGGDVGVNGLPPSGLPPASLPPAGLPPAGLSPAGLPSAAPSGVDGLGAQPPQRLAELGLQRQLHRAVADAGGHPPLANLPHHHLQGAPRHVLPQQQLHGAYAPPASQLTQYPQQPPHGLPAQPQFGGSQLQLSHLPLHGHGESERNSAARCATSMQRHRGSGSSDDGSGGSNDGSGGSNGSTEPTSINTDTHGLETPAPAQAPSESGRTQSRVAPFLTKLYTIVDDTAYDAFATWCRGGTAFRIADPLAFSEGCLPRFFKHNKMGSFQQQLLTYGFQRVPNSSCLDVSTVWQHERFLRGRPDLLEQIHRSMHRTSVKRGDNRKSGRNRDEGSDSEADVEEIGQMHDHIHKLCSSLNELHDELRSARVIEMRAIDALVDRIHKRLRPAEPVALSTLRSPTDSDPTSSEATGSDSTSAEGSGNEQGISRLDRRVTSSEATCTSEATTSTVPASRSKEDDSERSNGSSEHSEQDDEHSMGVEREDEPEGADPMADDNEATTAEAPRRPDAGEGKREAATDGKAEAAPDGPAANDRSGDAELLPDAEPAAAAVPATADAEPTAEAQPAAAAEPTADAAHSVEATQCSPGREEAAARADDSYS